MDTMKIREKFRELFGGGGEIYAAPGRINLIGEHTDYNSGYVFPGAIDKAIYCMIKPNIKDKVRAFAIDENPDKVSQYSEFGLQEEDIPVDRWAKYIFGTAREMIKSGAAIEGFDVVVSGDVPLGAGMSSSAALECSIGYALNDIFKAGFDKMQIAKTGQAAEHNYIGVKCGIMDQFASCFGDAGNLIRLDCRNMKYEYYPFDPKGYKLVLINTMVSHALGSEYNDRRASCERAVEELRKVHPHVKTLRDANLITLKEISGRISEEDYMRAEYVIEEKTRVIDVCLFLDRGYYEGVGRMMYETHAGLRDKYTVSCPELDFLNDRAKEYGVTGSRMMGGGFGGCTINLVKEDLYGEFVSRTTADYEKRFGIIPEVYDVVIGDGARKL
ncbi:MAG: galactokinase [Dysgonamonadaceae bacterium]|jgi:galactokinase|nr:galactokinase [Dysgonamonadaceae bacterium]